MLERIRCLGRYLKTLPGRVNRWGRYWVPIIALVVFAFYLMWRLVMLHMGKGEVKWPKYHYEREVKGLRGSIFTAQGMNYPVACSVPIWTYHVDTESVKKTEKRSPKRNASMISEVLHIPFEDVYAAYTKKGPGHRYVFLAESSDTAAHRALQAESKELGLSIEEKQVRMYPLGRNLSHIVGFVSRDPTNSIGAAGIEQRYERYLKPIPGMIKGVKDARQRELYDRRTVSVPATDGCDVYLTIDRNIQYTVETALRNGVATNGALAAWSIVMDVRTGAVLAMASLPDYEPSDFSKYGADKKKNRAIGENYEPGSVMKVITAAAAIEAGIVTPDTLYNTQKNDPRYYRLPGDAGHKWEPMMSIRDAIVHSSNIVIGKLGFDFGPKRLRAAMVAFGFGAKTGIELPGEELGLLPPLKSWDKAKWSRAPIGQGVAVTAIQLASAYAAIGNDGLRMRPYVVEKIVSAKNEIVYQHENVEVARPISAETARKVREMMLGVAKKGGTARRAAVVGYTVAGKTGTAQRPDRANGGYSSTDYNASFVGLVPASRPQIVVLVTFQNPTYCRRLGESVPIFNHQGGICAAPVFREITQSVVRYLNIEPDNPNEIPTEDEE